MKMLKKMLLINWHYFSMEEIVLDQLNFLTGRNAAGKSTLIDALQLVLLGETNSYFFNKAANEKSSRTLEGYLRGEIGDDGGAGFRNLRSGDFNTYVALEFFDDVKQAVFTAGIVFDVYGDGHHKHKFFIFDGPIPQSQFVENQLPLTIDQLRRTLKKTYGNRLQWPDTNRGYREMLMAKMGQVKPKFFSLFKKSVPFTPITDIETFITEYICDVKSNIDMSHMRDNLRSYKRLEQDAQLINERIGRLELIEKAFSETQASKNRIQMQQFLIDQGHLDRVRENLDLLQQNIEAYRKDKALLAESLAQLDEALANCQKKRDDKIIERAESDVQKRLTTLEREHEILSSQLRERERALSQIVSNLNEYGMNWMKALSSFTNIREGGTSNPGLVDRSQALISLASLMSTLSSDTLERLEEINLEEVNHQMLALVEMSQKEHFVSNQKLEEISEKLRAKKKILNQLESGIKPYSKEVTALRDHLEELLKHKTGTPQPVTVLADALEIKSPKWQAVIEGYLHTQKFNLIVAPEHFEDALRAYEIQKQPLRLFGVGLVDVEKIIGLGETIAQGSLAEEVSSDNPWAKAYADYLLGRVMKCEAVESLRKHGTAITPTGMLYKNFVASQMNPKRWETPFIGRKSIEAQMALLKSEMDALSQERVDIEAALRQLKPLTQLKGFSNNELRDSIQKIKDRHEIGKLVEAIKGLEKERESLDLTYLATLTGAIETLDKAIQKQTADMRKNLSEMGRLEEALTHLKGTELPKWEREGRYREERLTTVYPPKWMADFGLPRYEKERQMKALDLLIENFERSVKAEQTGLEKRRAELIELRSQYNRLFHMGHHIQDEENEDYDKALSELRENKLPSYLSQISDAKDKTYDQFRDEFLAKLKQNFDMIKSQLSELNAAIKACNFGNDQYKYKVEPKPEYRHFYDMITDELLMTEGISLSTYAFREKHGDAIDELFRMILDVENNDSADARSELEKNIKRFTDYRSYLNFDLIVTDPEGREQRLSKTLLKKSGGETQTPFYISVLASFAHLYRIHHQSQSSNNTIRLIVFDEAFSKMDSQRIKESLQLLRTFKLQAIISAPPDKIPDIAPYVDNNLCVIREQDISFVERFAKEQAGEF